MYTFNKALFIVLAIGTHSSMALAQATILYQNNWETTVNPAYQNSYQQCGQAVDLTSIHTLYGTPANPFQQTNTVERVLINAPGTHFADGRAYHDDPLYLAIPGYSNNYALGMQNEDQKDYLSLTLNTQGKSFINFSTRISPISIEGCGGNTVGGNNVFEVGAPKIRIRLLYTPGGSFNMAAYAGNPTGAYQVLDTQVLEGDASTSPWIFRWTQNIKALSAEQANCSTCDGNVTVVWDLMGQAEGGYQGYASFDDLIIASSDDPGDVGQNKPPLADAGEDQGGVTEGSLVSLDGSASSDPDGDALTYAWTQLTPGAYSVVLSGADTATPSFTAPTNVPRDGATLTFQLIVYDGEAYSEPSLVTIGLVDVNNAPVAKVEDDKAVAENAIVGLNGSSSYDPDLDPLTYMWEQDFLAQPFQTPVVLESTTAADTSFTAPLVGVAGETLTFKLTVSDGLLTSSDTIVISVNNMNQPPVANAGDNNTVTENSNYTLDGSASEDPDGDLLSFAWIQTGGPAVSNFIGTNTATPSFNAPSVAGAPATITFQLTVDDGYGGQSTDTVTVTVTDINAPPLCNNARPSDKFLWPPNHKLIPIKILGVSDPDNKKVKITVTSITQDEPVNGVGDGNTSPDATIQKGSGYVRSERSGAGNGRVYKINFTAQDSGGASCSGSVTVCVPHDYSKSCGGHKKSKTGCVDSGQNYNSLAK